METLKKIATIKNDFTEKFGVPRQSNLVNEITSTIVFEPEYRSKEALRGLEDFSHIWVIWGFSKAERDGWSPTVRPPRLGGNTRVGVFATRSPFRPNPIGLSSVQLKEIQLDSPSGPLLHILGADMINGTPVYDIKPYLPFVDSHPDAASGYASVPPAPSLKVDFPENLIDKLPDIHHSAVLKLLSHDPRPQYQNNSDRIYHMLYAGYDISFIVDCECLLVTSVDFSGFG